MIRRLLPLWLALAQVASGSPPRPDDRGVELLRSECASSLARIEVTLFANGTVRLREESAAGERTMALGEVGPEERQALVRRLGEIDLAEVESPRGSVEGAWVERCTVRLTLPELPPRRFAFSRLDSLPLGLDRLARIADELVAIARGGAPAASLPTGYRPLPGQCLRRRDGAVFEVIGLTADKNGVELQGAVVPLTVYVWLDRIGQEFAGPVPCP